ncbi:Asp23/Gls24 family envelope stress response protein [Ktedonospora formicarum]|uniref:Asp23/Gls24 family envelope stress response protein n=1 Tax=Ktedonospora formicarum TaxID=2778364 RepID=A0A8J3MR98_9CHLR|nr:Asp23/Gls24 family envelope stress response protein [Ktedonospora formicarum]GHO43423.1 hypothetical protein KSX_15860 [Ktedonospora formicarum]
MEGTYQNLGSIRVAKQVLSTIVTHSALLIPGVIGIANGSRTLPIRNQWSRMLGHDIPPQGVALNVKDNTVSADLYLVVDADADIVSLGSAVQDEVASALEEMVGMQVQEVNIYIHDIA